MQKKLIFVYNAKSGKMPALKDYFHKIISPKTYDCNLCALTYDLLGMKSEWKRAVEMTGLKTEFLHKDEFEKRYSAAYATPVILVQKGALLKELLSANEINKATSLKSLILMINKRLAAKIKKNTNNESSPSS